MDTYHDNTAFLKSHQKYGSFAGEKEVFEGKENV